MKKLFVLFLLVALVPFTIGCGLFGDNEDNTPINLTKLTAKASLLPAAAVANLRGSVTEQTVAVVFAGAKMTIGTVVLTAKTEMGPDAITGAYDVVFESDVLAANSAEYVNATTGVVEAVITNANGTTIATFAVDYTVVAATTTIAVTVAANGTVTSTTAGVTDSYATVTSATVTAGTLTPTITVVFSDDIGTIVAPTAFDVKVTKGTTTIAAAQADFITSYVAGTKTMTINLNNKTLVNGSTYTVKVNKIVSSTGVSVVAFTKTFTVTVQ